LVFTFLVSYWLAFTFFLSNTDSGKYASHITIHIMKVPKQSTMSVHDVTGKSVGNYLHHEGA
jgi:hypothetical protein